MATEAGSEQLARLRALLARLEPGPAAEGDDLIERMARFVAGVPSAELTHEAVQDALPVYLEARLRGAALTDPERPLKHHLDSCDECGVIYAMLLQHAADPIPADAEPVPAPDLGRLRRRPGVVTLRTFVTNLAHHLLELLRPREAPDLSYLAEPFFEQVAGLPKGAHFRKGLAGVLGASGRGRAEAPVAVRFLAVTYFTTQQLRERVTVEQLQGMKASAELTTTAEQIAFTVAHDYGFNRREAAEFATAYSRVLLESHIDLGDISAED